MKLQKIADYCYYSLVLNIIAIMCFSYKVNTSWIFYGTSILSSVLMLLYIVIKQKAIVIGEVQFTLFAWAGWVFASVLWSINGDISLIIAGTVAQLVIYGLIVYEYFKQSNIRSERLLNAISIGVVSMGIYSMYYYGFSGYFEHILFGFRVGGDINQENIYGNFAVMGLIVGVGQYLNKKSLLNVFVIVLSFLMVIGSGSKAAIISCMLGILILIVIKYGYGSLKKTAAAIACVLIVGWGLFTFLDDSAIVSRFVIFSDFFTSQNVTDNSTETRLYMIKFGLEHFLYQPIQGYGANCFEVLYQRSTGWATYSHNNFVELLVDLGVVGFVLFYRIYFIILLKSKKLDKEASIILVLLGITFINGMFGPNYSSKILYVLFAMGYHVSNTGAKKQMN